MRLASAMSWPARPAGIDLPDRARTSLTNPVSVPEASAVAGLAGGG